MNKENSKSAAGLRRSAIAERLRLKEEWSALKGIDSENNEHRNPLNKKPQRNLKPNRPQTKDLKKFPTRQQITSEAMRGVVAFVEVGAEPRALALRATLMALGASVMPAWSPLVTHLIWSHSGCHKIRARARALACQLVSPQWVEACASAAKRLPEKFFPAPSRPSDLPSPATLRQLLKKAEYENITLHLSASSQSGEGKTTRLRISSECENSEERSGNKSHDQSLNNLENIANPLSTQSRVPAPQPAPPAKSRRKLFTQKENDIITTDDNNTTLTPAHQKKQKLTQRQKRDFKLTEKIARKLIETPIKKKSRTILTSQKQKTSPRIVLSGMSKLERHTVSNAIRSLNGKLQSEVNKRTTHVLLGSCKENTSEINQERNVQENNNERELENNDEVIDLDNQLNGQNLSMCEKCNAPEVILKKLLTDESVIINDHCTQNVEVPDGVTIICCKKLQISGVTALNFSTKNNQNIEDIVNKNINKDLQRVQYKNLAQDTTNNNIQIENTSAQNSLNKDTSVMYNADVVSNKLRTVNALLGAVRGCRVLHAQWAIDCAKESNWIPHFGYEVPHLLKISQKARVERSALGRMRSEYAYDVFNGTRVHVRQNASQRYAVIQLLTLCGACIEDGNCDFTIGLNEGDINSKWVFDSIAAARIRTTRRYMNKVIPTDAAFVTKH